MLSVVPDFDAVKIGDASAVTCTDLGERGQLQRDRHLSRFAERDVDVLDDRRPEAGQLDHQAVRTADADVLQREPAVTLGDALVVRAGRDVHRGHGGAGQHAALRVGDDPADRAGRHGLAGDGLRPRHQGDDQAHNCCADLLRNAIHGERPQMK